MAELAVKHDLLVLSDEIYARIIYGADYISMMSYHGVEERTLTIDGFSKSFAVTGWRLGYTVVPARIVPAIDLMAVNSYTSVAEFTKYAAIEALKDPQGAAAHGGRVRAQAGAVRARSEPRARTSLGAARWRVLRLGEYTPG